MYSHAGLFGDIYISGDGVGKGYIDRDDLTAKSYLVNPFKDNSIMYKSGDLGKWLPDGTIECMGREDYQVKLRGLRIELGEIEECINSFGNNLNQKSAVIVKEENNKLGLHAFISSNSSIDINSLKTYLSNKLPTYMLPNTYTFLDKLPMTLNGKINRKVLSTYKTEKNREIVLPRNKIDELLVLELNNLLNVDNISITDSFFELGGDSLLAIKLCAKISSKYGIDFSVRDIFENSIIKNISDNIASKTNSIYHAINKARPKEYYNLSSAEKRIYYSCKIADESSLLYNVPGVISFDKKPDVERLNKCFEKLIQKHLVLRTYFKVIDDEVYQKVLPSVSFEIEEMEDTSISLDEIMKNFVKPFDLSKAPLLHVGFVKNKDKYLLLFDIHHIICDGMSLSLLTNELSKLYNETEPKALSDEERNRLIFELNNTKVDYQESKTVISYFEEFVKKTPNKTALVFEEKSFSYKELNNKANVLAKFLVQNGVKSKDVVAIMVPRSPEMIASILAVLKLGACYLPIDPKYPLDRINYMLSDSDAKTILVNSDTSDFEVETSASKISVDLDSLKDEDVPNINFPIKPDDLIYLIYTSGSTGLPKGVKISHKNISNFLTGVKKEIDFSHEKSMVSVTTFCFDIFALEIWGSLTSGMTLILANDMEVLSPLPLKELCKRNNVSMIQTTPSRLNTLLRITEGTDFWSQFSDIMVGGEAFPKTLLEKLHSNTDANIFNMYGPTETTVWSTIKNLTNENEITIRKTNFKYKLLYTR